MADLSYHSAPPTEHEAVLFSLRDLLLMRTEGTLDIPPALWRAYLNDLEVTP